MAIKSMVGAGGKLYLHTDSGLHTLKNNGREPRDWDKDHFSSTPGDSPFMAFFFDELQDLVKTSAIFDQDRQELVDTIMVMVTEGFLPAYEDLRAIRAMTVEQHIRFTKSFYRDWRLDVEQRLTKQLQLPLQRKIRGRS
jgi:hypothetical protein